MKRYSCRDISLERRMKAVACVRRHLRELSALLEAVGLSCRVVEGSAVAAEVYLAETNTMHTAVRVAITVSPEYDRPLRRALGRAGFARGEATGDLNLVRLASRHGRRALHVLFAGDGVHEEPAAARRHPADPEARRARDARLRTAWLELTAVYVRVRHRETPEHDVTESFEVQVIAAPSRSHA